MGYREDCEALITPKLRRFSPKLRSSSEILEANASARIAALPAGSYSITVLGSCRYKGLTILILIRLCAPQAVPYSVTSYRSIPA